tara:strand:+ start:167 stop:559 length:393 start_codon:yes stop_codon:yes gene_type:complete
MGNTNTKNNSLKSDFNIFLILNNQKIKNLEVTKKILHKDTLYLYLKKHELLKNNVRNFSIEIYDKQNIKNLNINILLDNFSSSKFIDEKKILNENIFLNENFEFIVRYDNKFNIKELLLKIYNYKSNKLV